MYGAAKLVALAATFSTALGAYQGFNYGATWPDGRGKTQADYEAEFTAQKNLPNTNGAFSSARLYTMIVSVPGTIIQVLVLEAWLTKTTASRNCQLPDLRHPGRHLHQDQPAARPLVLSG